VIFNAQEGDLDFGNLKTCSWDLNNNQRKRLPRHLFLLENNVKSLKGSCQLTQNW